MTAWAIYFMPGESRPAILTKDWTSKMCKSTCADCQVETTDTDVTGTTVLCDNCCYTRELADAVDLFCEEIHEHLFQTALSIALERFAVSREDLLLAVQSRPNTIC